jgi:short-subunit dehydrogenase
VTERITLITGASAGIGTELVRVFSANGHRLALAARRADRLTVLAAEITASGGVAPLLIPCDLEAPDACDKIAEALGAAGLDVEYVVNDAGYGLFGRAIELDRADQLGIIAVNIRALTDLSLRFSDSLIRNRGGILNVGSIAGFLPGPGIAPYGVRVTVVCPGPVPSEFQDRAGFKPGFDSAILNVSAADVAQQAYRGLMANRRIVLPGLGIKMVPPLLRLFPRAFILAAVGLFQLRKR